ncbi:hypothetical protein CEXT_387011 [Caerostris extrusa]|uniref:Uncharacterized protein n=1 Tax=Caerostris extrusa TaxID=172846 RepID=A0AAV4TUQ7_CAEEX|nr:hypothetical protein CEXT_387011 [Caerostris extrusa]
MYLLRETSETNTCSLKNRPSYTPVCVSDPTVLNSHKGWPVRPLRSSQVSTHDPPLKNSQPHYPSLILILMKFKLGSPAIAKLPSLSSWSNAKSSRDNK